MQMAWWQRVSISRPGVPGVAVAVVAAVAAGAIGMGVASAAPGSTTDTVVAASPVAGTPCSVTAKACVELATHTAWLLDQGRIVRGPVSFADGDVNAPTPRGNTYKVEWKAQHWVSREYGTPMPNAVFFAPGGISFHEGRQDTPSAGCVKLTAADAQAWFDYLKVGDQVQVR